MGPSSPQPPRFPSTAVAAMAGVLVVLMLGSCGSESEGDPARNVKAAGHEYYLPFVAAPGGVYLVNAGDFDEILHAATHDVGARHVLYRLAPTDGAGARAQPNVMAYTADDDWYRIWLDARRSQVPVRVGSPGSAQGHCYSLLLYGDLDNPENGLIVYGTRGANGICGDEDDAILSLPLEGTGQAPAAFPAIPYVGVYGTDGALAAVLARQADPSALVFVEYPSGAVIHLADAPGITGYLAVTRGGAFVWVGQQLHYATTNGQVSPVLFTLETNREIASRAVSDGEHLYFSDYDSASVDRTPGRLWRVRVDGTTSAEILREFASEVIEYVDPNVINGQVWLFNSEGDAEILRAAAKEPTGPSSVVDRVESGGIAYVYGGERSFYNSQDRSTGSLTVTVVERDGTTAFQSTNAQISGRAAGTPEVFSESGSAPATHVMWVQGNSNANVLAGTNGSRGADLVAYDLRSPRIQHLWRIDREALLFTNSIGPTGLGSLHYALSDREDIFAYDVEDGRFKVITNTPGTDEEPIN